MKTCLRCKKSLPLSKFGTWAIGKDGKQVWCRQCRSAYQQINREVERKRCRDWYQANKKKHQAYHKAWKASNPKRASAINRSYLARRRTSTANMTPQEWLDRLVEFNGHCAYCLQPSPVLEMEHMQPLSRGGDHVIENVVPACRTCNATKHTRTLLEFISREAPESAGVAEAIRIS